MIKISISEEVKAVIENLIVISSKVKQVSNHALELPRVKAEPMAAMIATDMEAAANSMVSNCSRDLSMLQLSIESMSRAIAAVEEER